MSNVDSRLICQRPIWMVLKSPQLIISFKLITFFEYALKSVDRPKPTAVFHINMSRQKYYLATSVLADSYGPPVETYLSKCQGWSNRV